MRFNPPVQYEWEETCDLVKKYRLDARGCKCSLVAKKWYNKSIAYQKIGEKYGSHDYHYFYYHDWQHCVLDQEKEKEYFLRSIECTKHAAEEGHEIAMVTYGLFLYHFMPNRHSDAFSWFMKASERELALADYAVACCYAKGIGTKRNRKLARTYMKQFKTRWKCSMRQRALAFEIRFNGRLPFAGTLYAWCCGRASVGYVDIPKYMPFEWFYDNDIGVERDFGITLDTDVMEGVHGDDYFSEYYYM